MRIVTPDPMIARGVRDLREEMLMWVGIKKIRKMVKREIQQKWRTRSLLGMTEANCMLKNKPFPEETSTCSSQLSDTVAHKQCMLERLASAIDWELGVYWARGSINTTNSSVYTIIDLLREMMLSYLKKSHQAAAGINIWTWITGSDQNIISSLTSIINALLLKHFLLGKSNNRCKRCFH